MHLAWLYLLHAEFTRDGIDYRYWDPKFKHRLLRVDGEPKRWELERCLRERWPDETDAVRANLSLFIRLRNRLEHRHAHADAALMVTLSGHAHALLLNYEHELTDQFGDDQSLALRLRIPLFFGTFSPQGEQALRRLRKTLPADLRGFLTDYESGLDEQVVRNPQYEFRLRATVELAPKDPEAVAVQFTRYDDMTEEERAAVEEMGRKGQVIVRDRKQPVSGLGRLMPNRRRPRSRRVFRSCSTLLISRRHGNEGRCARLTATQTRIAPTLTSASMTNLRSPTATRERT